MADSTITGLTAAAAITGTEVLPVDQSGSTVKATVANLTPGLSAVVGDSGSGGTKGLVPAPPSGSAAAGKFLKADGTFAVPASGGSLVLVEQHTASTSATLDFTTWYSSTYDEYVIELVNVVPVTDAVNLLFRVSTDAGSTWDSGANYQWVGFRASKAGSAPAGATGATSIGIDGSGGQSNSATTGGICGTIRLFAPGSTTLHKRLRGEIGINDGTASPDITVMISGAYASTTAITGLRFLFSSGNIASGIIRVYGIAKV